MDEALGLNPSKATYCTIICVNYKINNDNYFCLLAWKQKQAPVFYSALSWVLSMMAPKWNLNTSLVMCWSTAVIWVTRGHQFCPWAMCHPLQALILPAMESPLPTMAMTKSHMRQPPRVAQPSSAVAQAR